MPSFVTGKRSRLLPLAVSGALAAGAITAATVTLPATASAAASPASASPVAASPVSANSVPSNLEIANQQGAMSAFGLGIRRYAYEKGKQAAEKAAAAKAATVAAAKAQQAQARTQTKIQSQAAAQHQATGSPRQIAKGMLGQFNWSGSQFSCLDPLWAHESGWSVTAANAGSGAYGIPQALPGSKMGSVGPDWQANAATQIRWGLNYIQGTYGSPCAAWSHEESDGWY